MVPLNFLDPGDDEIAIHRNRRCQRDLQSASALTFTRLGQQSTRPTTPSISTIDEGCSGIRSLMAIAMLSAIYGAFHAGSSLEKAGHFRRRLRIRDRRKRRTSGVDHGHGALFWTGSGRRTLSLDLRLSLISVCTRSDVCCSENCSTSIRNKGGGSRRRKGNLV